MFVTFVLTGLRRSELRQLRWGEVNRVEGTLRVVESKLEEGERLIALPAPLVDEHYTVSAHRSDHDYVFVHPTKGSPIDADWFRERLNAAVKTAAIDDHVRVHDLRHTAATNLAATGAATIAVMATARHRSMSTTNQYVHRAGVVFRDDADALGRRLLGVEDPGRNQPEPAPVREER